MRVVKVTKATVKGATRTGNLLWNITTEGVELDVARFITNVQTCRNKSGCGKLREY